MQHKSVEREKKKFFERQYILSSRSDIIARTSIPLPHLSNRMHTFLWWLAGSSPGQLYDVQRVNVYAGIDTIHKAEYDSFMDFAHQIEELPVAFEPDKFVEYKYGNKMMRWTVRD